MVSRSEILQFWELFETVRCVVSKHDNRPLPLKLSFRPNEFHYQRQEWQLLEAQGLIGKWSFIKAIPAHLHKTGMVGGTTIFINMDHHIYQAHFLYCPDEAGVF